MYLLLYADNIVIIAENKSDRHNKVDFINQWCKKWRHNINYNKSNIIHLRERKYINYWEITIWLC